MSFFDGFADERVDVGEVTLRVRYAGAGPAVLLVHGHPRTGATWHRVAPRLVDAGPATMGEQNHAELRRATRDPETVRAMLEDYRAGLGVDRDDEEADPLAVWEPWCTDLRGHPVDSGHHVAEENPAELTAALLGFLGVRGAS